MEKNVKGTIKIVWSEVGNCRICPQVYNTAHEPMMGFIPRCKHGWSINLPFTCKPNPDLCWGPGEYPRPEPVQEPVIVVDPNLVHTTQCHGCRYYPVVLPKGQCVLGWGILHPNNPGILIRGPLCPGPGKWKLDLTTAPNRVSL
jgi:hypothetical protein